MAHHPLQEGAELFGFWFVFAFIDNYCFRFGLGIFSDGETKSEFGPFMFKILGRRDGNQKRATLYSVFGKGFPSFLCFVLCNSDQIKLPIMLGFSHHCMP